MDLIHFKDASDILSSENLSDAKLFVLIVKGSGEILSVTLDRGTREVRIFLAKFGVVIESTIAATVNAGWSQYSTPGIGRSDSAGCSSSRDVGGGVGCLAGGSPQR